MNLHRSLRALALGFTGLAASAAAAQLSAPSAREQAVAAERVNPPLAAPAVLERLLSGLRLPWSLAFLPGSDMLLTEKHHGLRLVRGGVLQAGTITGGPPQVLAKEDSGWLDVVLDPDFDREPWLYIAFVEGDERANRTAIWKARFDGRNLVDGRVILRTQPDKSGISHPGGRLLFLPDKTLLLTVGDGFTETHVAQDLRSHLGKVLRIDRQGAVPADNPLVGRVDALPQIWTWGHRNAQGLALDRRTGDVWLHEHGPRGGDEINLLRPGANYGWPIVTHGVGYDGKLISERSAAPGIERSSFYWAPSIAPSGLVVYRGQAFTDWQGKLLVGGLASRSVVRLRRGRETGLFVEEERLFGGLNRRFRDVREGPDGLLYLLTDEVEGLLLRMRPADARP